MTIMRSRYLPNNYIKRFIEAYLLIKFELSSIFKSFIGLIKSKITFNKSNLNKLEIGAGNLPKKEGFITVDLNLRSDYPYDLRIGLPFPDSSIDFIYSEHVLEHFNYKDLLNLLEECYRVLKNNGIFSAAIPTPRIYLEAYFNPEGFDYKKYCDYDFGLSFKNKIDYVNYIFYMGGHHHYMFDEENIVSILKDIGFTNVKLRHFDQRLDQEARRSTSIYVEASKERDR